MTKDERKGKKHQKPPGPKADRLKIDMPWKDAIDKALHKKKPKDGWPKPEK